MNETTVIILTSSYDERSKDLHFDRPVDLLNINGQALLERYLILFDSYRVILMIGKENEYYFHKFKKYSNVEMVVLNQSLCSKSEQLLTAFDYINKDTTLVTIIEANTIISYDFFNYFLSIDTSRKYISSLGHIGFFTFPYSMLSKIISRLNKTQNASNVFAELTDESFKMIDSKKNEYDYVIEKKDYQRILTNGFEILPYRKFYSKFNLLEKPMKRFVGVYDVVGAKLAQTMGFDGLWLGSYQIALSFGVEDDETYNPIIAIELSKRLIDNNISLPQIIDIGSGFNSINDLDLFASYCNKEKNIVGICVDDNSLFRKNSMLETTERQILTTKEFIERINSIKTFFREDILFLGRTEIIIANGNDINWIELKDKGKHLLENCADAFLPHYVGNDPHFYKQMLSEIHKLHPIVSIPTGLIDYQSSFFAEQGVDLIIYANIDLRSRIELLISMFQNINSNNRIENTSNLIKADKIKEIFERLVKFYDF